MIIFIMELVGTIAFAVSGAMTGIQRRMDLFGVNVLGVTTAVGGGLIRDLILGMNPPAMFRRPVYALTAVAVSTVTFFFVYIKEKSISKKGALWETLTHPLGEKHDMHATYEHLLFLGDTLGLGVFTVMGSYTAVTNGYGSNRFLMIFVGVLTGVGGGMLRDIMAGNMPYVLVKHVYAVAALAGAVIYTYLLSYLGGTECLLVGAAVVMLIRFLAARYRWNLPRIQ